MLLCTRIKAWWLGGIADSDSVVSSRKSSELRLLCHCCPAEPRLRMMRRGPRKLRFLELP